MGSVFSNTSILVLNMIPSLVSLGWISMLSSKGQEAESDSEEDARVELELSTESVNKNQCNGSKRNTITFRLMQVPNLGDRFF